MLLVNTRLDICFLMKILSQYMTEPLHAHWVAAKHILSYLHGTINLGLRQTSKYVKLHGYDDANWDGNTIDGKTHLGATLALDM